jgi:hypothetical protein
VQATDASAFGLPGTGIERQQREYRDNEFFIYLSKKDRTVVRTSGLPSEDERRK